MFSEKLLSDMEEGRLGIIFSGIPRLERATNTFFSFLLLSFNNVQFRLRVGVRRGGERKERGSSILILSPSDGGGGSGRRK